MAQRSLEQQFGNLESGDNVPYTVSFDKARKGRGRKMVNPNDPQENPGLLNDDSSSSHAPAAIPRDESEPEELIGQGAVRPAHERRKSREDGELRPYANSSVCPDNQNRRAPSESGKPRYGGGSGGEPQRRLARPIAGSEHSIERSPLHPQFRIFGNDSGGFPSPSWDAKNSYESRHGSPPGRSHPIRYRSAGMNNPYGKVTKPAPTSTKTGCFSWFRKLLGSR